jgi:hypothetical protein
MLGCQRLEEHCIAGVCWTANLLMIWPQTSTVLVLLKKKVLYWWSRFFLLGICLHRYMGKDMVVLSGLDPGTGETEVELAP